MLVVLFGRENHCLTGLQSGEVNLVQGGIGSDSPSWSLLGFFVLAAIHVPHLCFVRLQWTIFLPHILNANLHWGVVDVRNSVPIYRDFALARVKLVKEDSAISGIPLLHLLGSDA